MPNPKVITRKTLALTKLSEECGELVQALCKKSYSLVSGRVSGSAVNTRMDKHIEEEMADVLAACDLVKKTLGLNESRIEKRVKAKKKKLRT